MTEKRSDAQVIDDLRNYVSTVSERRVERQTRVSAARAAADARHAAARAKVHPLLGPVLDHHGPYVGEYYPEPAECHGCDEGPRADAGALWPCSTWRLITGETEG